MADPGGPSGAVAEITLTSGTGPYQLSAGPPGGPLAQYFRFADVFLDGAPITYEVDDTARKEVVEGVFNLATNTLSRDTVLFSSNGNALIDWPATGQRTVRPLVAFPLCDTPPTDGQVLAWDAATKKYCPITLTDDDAGGGGGGSTIPPICNTPPSAGQILVFDATTGEYCPADLCALVAACINGPQEPLLLFLAPSSVSISDNAPAGTLLTTATLRWSNGLPYTGLPAILTTTEPGLIAGDGMRLVTARDLSPADDTAMTDAVTVTATTPMGLTASIRLF